MSPVRSDDSNKNPEAQPAQKVEEMTLGYPNSLLIANNIEPTVLEYLPAELRVEILSQIQNQLEAWKAN